jgi:predicted TIM-barrel fold metal-dependent hydrolase
MWGSDFPHVRSVGVDAQSAVGKMLAELPPQDQDKIVGLNTAALYNIDYDELYWTKQAAE